jgi:hypothetical protein
LKQANWSFWRKVDRVALIDAVLLSVDLDPETEPRNVGSGKVRYQLFHESLLMIDAVSGPKLEKRTRIVLSSIGTRLSLETEGYDLTDLVRLPVFGDYADSIGLQLPVSFPRLKATAPRRAAGWPWGAYETPLLKELAAAAAHFWAGNPDPTAAPTNDDVMAWLAKRGVASGRNADAIARILRRPDLPHGPREKKFRK